MFLPILLATSYQEEIIENVAWNLRRWSSVMSKVPLLSPTDKTGDDWMLTSLTETDNPLV